MVSQDRTDAEVIAASLVEPAQFGVIFVRHFGSIFKFAARRIGTEDGRDVAADTFVRAFGIRHRYDLTRDDCLPWLYGIASNIIGDRLRRVRRRQRTYLANRGHPSFAEPYEDADSRVTAASVAGALGDAMRRLSARDRDTLLLYALDGLSYAEIAQVLDIPIGTVSSRIARARRRISELIPDLEQRTGSTPIDQPEKDDD